MAWDEYERDGRTLMGGDVPLDELTVALQAIARGYESRFRRLPLVDEILLALEQVLGAVGERYVADPEGLDTARFYCHRSPSIPRRRYIDPLRYEAAFADEPAPGRYIVEKKRPGGAHDVLVVPRLKLNGRALEADYRAIDTNEVDDDVAEQLITRTILEDFSDNFYRGKADSLVLTNLDSGVKRTVPYS